MGIQSNSLAYGRGASIENKQFKATAEVLTRKQLFIGTYDAAKTTIVPDVPVLFTSPEDIGDKCGFGSMLHRLALANWKGSKGQIESWFIPQEDESDAVKATGNIVFTASGLLAGTIALFIAGDKVTVTVTTGMTSAQVATAVYNAINAIKELPVVATNETPGQVDLTAKMYGTYGNGITIKFNLDNGDKTPVGLTYEITSMIGGLGVPDIATALDALGTDDDANEYGFTDVIHGYGRDTTTMDAILAYVGAGNEAIGLYNNLVGRPFRTAAGDTVAGSAGLADLLVVGGLRKEDRANAIIGIPGSPNHPEEIAAQAIGHAARINNSVAQQDYADILLEGVYPGDKSDRWTSNYTNRDTAVKAGISTTKVKAGKVYIQNFITLYHPDNVPVSSNGYRAFCHISVSQNLLASTRQLNEKAEWQRFFIVADTAKVSNSAARQYARDTNAYLDALVDLVKAWEKIGWIYTAAYTIDELKKAGAVTIRDGNTGFDATLKVIYPGIGWIINTNVEFDTSIAVLQS